MIRTFSDDVTKVNIGQIFSYILLVLVLAAIMLLQPCTKLNLQMKKVSLILLVLMTSVMYCAIGTSASKDIAPMKVKNMEIVQHN